MAIFAKVNDQGMVIRLMALHNLEYDLTDTLDTEERGLSIIAAIDTTPGTWLQASYTGDFRGALPLIGATWDDVGEVFVNPPSVWTLANAWQYLQPDPATAEGYGPDDLLEYDQYGTHRSVT
jgi:hypothetical protein